MEELVGLFFKKKHLSLPLFRKFPDRFFKEVKWNKGQKPQNTLRVPPFEGRLKRPHWKRTLLRSRENLIHRDLKNQLDQNYMGFCEKW